MAGHLRVRAGQWRDRDPDPRTRAQIDEWLRTDDLSELERAFASPLEFGTAGLRGPVGPGSARMNRLQVHRTCWALADYIKGRTGLEAPVVLVGHDARLDSSRFARQAVATLLAQGCSVVVAGQAPTPFVAFGALELGAHATVVVTASHNPAGDNGLKVYDDQGLQIVAPWDREIAQRMARAPTAPDTPRADVPSLPSHVQQCYLRALTALSVHCYPMHLQPQAPPVVAYTPLHGVGAALSSELAAVVGLDLRPVEEQVVPDGHFPTVSFPNPEQPGVLGRLKALAEGLRCEVAVAHDPDADRFALCLRDGEGGMYQLTGDEVGALFADTLLQQRRGTCVSTVVSSPWLDEIAAARGGQVVRTLTGFKWLCRAAASLPDFVFAYEEALGYCFAPPEGHRLARDKDGLAAMAVLAAMLRRYGSGGALYHRLVELSLECGLFVSTTQSVSVLSQPQADEMMLRLRLRPPRAIGGSPIEAACDYSQGAGDRPEYLGRQDLLQYRLVDGAVVLVRPSGTEPKIKVYAHARDRLSRVADYSSAKATLLRRAVALAEEVRRLLESDGLGA